MNEAHKRQAMLALDERIIQLFAQGNHAEALIAYQAYIELDGFYSLSCFRNLAQARCNNHFLKGGANAEI